MPPLPVEPVIPPALPPPVKAEPVAIEPPPASPPPPAKKEPEASPPAPKSEPAAKPKEQASVKPKEQPAANKPAQNRAERPTIPVRTADPVQNLPSPVKAEDVKIIPGVPDRNSAKSFRLQVGAYSTQNLALKVAEYVKTAGLAVELESVGSVYRVLIPGIAARDVYPASVRLGALGFGQIWVRE